MDLGEEKVSVTSLSAEQIKQKLEQYKDSGGDSFAWTFYPCLLLLVSRV